MQKCRLLEIGTKPITNGNFIKNKIKYNIFFFLLSFSSHIFAGSQSATCQFKTEISNAISKLTIADCGLAQALVKDKEVQSYHRKKIYETLSEKLATQLQQSLEETVLLDQYYAKNNKDLLPSGQSSVKDNCKLETIGKIETCNGKMNPQNPNYESFTYKSQLLKSQLKNNISKNCFQENLSLQDILNNKVTQILGLPVKNGDKCGEETNSCPIKGSSGAFTIMAQFDNKSAEEFIHEIQDPKSFLHSDKINNLFDSYPQLKLIKNSTGNLKSEFINYLKTYTSSSGKSAQEFINHFIFKNEANLQKLSETLGNQCKDLNKNLYTFLCGKDLEGSQLASLDPVISKKLFKLNPELSNEDIFENIPQDGESFYLAYGFQCLAKSTNTIDLKLVANDSLDSWYAQFTDKTTPRSSNTTDIEIKNSDFCSVYKCNDVNIKQTSACKNGGPITSKALISEYNCNNISCDSKILKYISYLEQLELNQNIFSQKSFAKSNSSLPNANPNNAESNYEKPRYSAFLENYLGVKGTLAAEGKAITTITMEEKSKEILERKTESLPIPDIKISASKLPKIIQNSTIANSTPPTDNFSSRSEQNTIDTIEKNSLFDKMSEKSSASFSNAKQVHTEKLNSKSFTPYGNNDKTEEQKLRSELEELTNSIKGNNTQKLATITDVNSNFSPIDIGGSNKTKTIKELSNSDKEKNDQYQRQLSAWESRLRNWQRDLADRDTRGIASSQNDTSAKKSESNSNSTQVNSKMDTQVQLYANTNANSNGKDDGKEKNSNAKNRNGLTTKGNTDSLETIVSSEELSTMKEESLKKLGINSKSTFIIKIRHKEKFYNVAVKIFWSNGADILVPLLNESNKAISKIILESPLFSSYKQFQINRQKERNDLVKNSEL